MCRGTFCRQYPTRNRLFKFITMLSNIGKCHESWCSVYVIAQFVLPLDRNTFETVLNSFRRCTTWITAWNPLMERGHLVHYETWLMANTVFCKISTYLIDSDLTFLNGRIVSLQDIWETKAAFDRAWRHGISLQMCRLSDLSLPWCNQQSGIMSRETVKQNWQLPIRINIESSVMHNSQYPW